MNSYAGSGGVVEVPGWVEGLLKVEVPSLSPKERYGWAIWMVRFSGFCRGDRRHRGADLVPLVKLFLKRLRDDPEVEGWRFEEARQALRVLVLGIEHWHWHKGRPRFRLRMGEHGSGDSGEMLAEGVAGCGGGGQELAGRVRARGMQGPPTALSMKETRRLLAALSGRDRLVAELIYGCGLRLEECLSLRVKDVDFDRLTVEIRQGKGGENRNMTLPRTMVAELRRHLERVRLMWKRDQKDGVGGYLPDAPARNPRNPGSAGAAWPWFWLFPAKKRSADPRSDFARRRHHVHAGEIRRTVCQAAEAAGIGRRVTCSALRHSFASHLLEAGADIRTVEKLLGRGHFETGPIDAEEKQRRGPASAKPMNEIPDWDEGDGSGGSRIAEEDGGGGYRVRRKSSARADVMMTDVGRGALGWVRMVAASGSGFQRGCLLVFEREGVECGGLTPLWGAAWPVVRIWFLKGPVWSAVA